MLHHTTYRSHCWNPSRAVGQCPSQWAYCWMAGLLLQPGARSPAHWEANAAQQPRRALGTHTHTHTHNAPLCCSERVVVTCRCEHWLAYLCSRSLCGVLTERGRYSDDRCGRSTDPDSGRRVSVLQFPFVALCAFLALDHRVHKERCIERPLNNDAISCTGGYGVLRAQTEASMTMYTGLFFFFYVSSDGTFFHYLEVRDSISGFAILSQSSWY